MISATTYRQITAALLMALYIFIAIPVWIWHKHDYSYTSKSSTGSETNTACSASDSQTYFEEVCGICSHKFSPYSYNLPICFDVPLILKTEKKAFYSEDIIITPCSHLPNKGPPAIS